MNESTLEIICSEIARSLQGKRLGKIFPLSRFETAIDFRLPDSRYLFISVEPSAPRIYLITRRLRDLERSSGNPSPFLLALKKRLSGATLDSVEKIPGERVLRFAFSGQDEMGNVGRHSLIVQITGRSANLFLLDEENIIMDSLRETRGQGQEAGHKYATPSREGDTRRKEQNELFSQEGSDTLSGALDSYHLEKEAEKRFQAEAQSARNRIKQELSRNEKLSEKLRGDLSGHGDPEKWKRSGDLLLANVTTARRDGEKIYVTDYYDENMPEIVIDADINQTVSEAAEKFFKLYTKARNARIEIAKRLQIVDAEIGRLKLKKERIETAIAGRDETALDEFLTPKAEAPARGKKKNRDFTGARRFVSSEGFEILVGKGAKDNDFLTFRVAKSLDLWMHAADYPGSHVVVKNPSRQEIPPRTLLEAAQIAAFYSQAREQPKAAVHYTQKKFVNKPKGAVLGLVSLSSFKTILVEPKIGEARKENAN
jgi:predicted ribosome quality control (RQC) complex YloA/Tae2 family protein